MYFQPRRNRNNLANEIIDCDAVEIIDCDAEETQPIIDLDDNLGQALDVILVSTEDDNDQYVNKVFRTLNENIETISISDSDSDVECVAEYMNDDILTCNRIERNPVYRSPPNGKTEKVTEVAVAAPGPSPAPAPAPAPAPTPPSAAASASTPASDTKKCGAESPKSTSSESSKNEDSDVFDFSSSPEESSDDESEYEEEESNHFYQPMPISVGPLPSMPLYDMEFNLVQEVVPLPIKEEVLSEGEPDLQPAIKRVNLYDSESDSNDSLDDSNADVNGVYPEVFYHADGKKKFKYWAAMAKRPIDKGEISEKELQAILQEEENLKKKQKSSENGSEEESDGEESGREDAKRNGLDFYEDIVQFQIGSTTSSRLLVVKDEAVFEEYEQCIEQLQQLIQWAPSFHKYELYLLLYPLIALTYLQMMASDNFPKARLLVNRYTSHLDDSFTPRLSKLLNICRPADVPHRARKLLAGFEKLEMHMSAGAYTHFVEHMEDWTKEQQEKVLTHFLIRRYSDKQEPKQLFAPGQPLLEVVFWAPPEPLHKTDFATRPVLLRSRRRKKGSMPERNIHLPPLGRIYTPTPKRMDLLRRKTDEQYRKKLDRNNLPSAYLYTAPHCDEVVTCATFSEGIGVLAVGTRSSSIHIFSLKSSKLLQLKSAQWLKALDTGMAGIDKGMLDPTTKHSRRTLLGHQGAVYRLSFNPEDRYLLSCSEDCSVRLWCLVSWNCMVIFPGHLSAVTCVTYAPLGYYFATASDDGTARIWVQDNKRPVRVLRGHLAEVEVCLFHPNRHYLATGSTDATVRLWDLPKGAQVRLFAGHRGRVTALAFSLCGRYLVSGGDDCLIMIWDIANEKLIHFLTHHKLSINSIQFCLDNNLLVVGGQDCQLTIWDFKKILQNTKSTRSKHYAESPPAEDFLIKSFYSKNAPFYTIRFTRRNLLLAFCVAARVPEKSLLLAREKREMQQRRRENLSEWLDVLDAMKMEAVVAVKS